MEKVITYRLQIHILLCF